MATEMTEKEVARLKSNLNKLNGKKNEPEKRFDIDIIEVATKKVMSHYQRDMPLSRALNYQKKAYEGLGDQTEYEVVLIERL